MTKEDLNKKQWIIDRPVKNGFNGIVYQMGITESGDVIWSDGTIEDRFDFKKNVSEYNSLREQIAKKQRNGSC